MCSFFAWLRFSGLGGTWLIDAPKLSGTISLGEEFCGGRNSFNSPSFDAVCVRCFSDLGYKSCFACFYHNPLADSIRVLCCRFASSVYLHICKAAFGGDCRLQTTQMRIRPMNQRENYTVDCKRLSVRQKRNSVYENIS